MQPNNNTLTLFSLNCCCLNAILNSNKTLPIFDLIISKKLIHVTLLKQGFQNKLPLQRLLILSLFA